MFSHWMIFAGLLPCQTWPSPHRERLEQKMRGHSSCLVMYAYIALTCIVHSIHVQLAKPASVHIVRIQNLGPIALAMHVQLHPMNNQG